MDRIIPFPGSVDELRARSQRLHRYAYGTSMQNMELNIPPPNGHLRPLKFQMERQKL